MDLCGRSTVHTIQSILVGIARPLVKQFLTMTSDKSLADEYRYGVMLLEKHRTLIGDKYGFVRRWLDIKQCWLERRHGAFCWNLAQLAVRYPRESLRRLAISLPNMASNRAFSRFHLKSQR